MKKKLALLLVATLTVSAFSGCSKTDSDSTETVRSGQFDLVPSECVTSLADYSAIEVTLEDNYTVTDEYVTYAANSYLSYFGLYGEVTDRTVVEDGDVVEISYVGYMDGEAFEGGTSDSDILFDVTNNADLTNGSYYIDGFNADLVGASVGDTVSTSVTFPEDYDEDFAGKDAVFEITIHGIYETGTIDNITDQQIYDALFEDYAFETVQDYVDNIRLILEYNMESEKYYDTVDAVRDYMVENSTVDVPEEYITARFNEYEAQFIANIDDGTTLEDYLSENYGMTVEEAEETWMEVIRDEVAAEMIFAYIAELEGITYDDDTYESYIENIMSNDTDLFTSEDAVYEYYGNGYADEGKAYVQRLCLVTLAIQSVANNAVVTLENQLDEDSTEETTEETEVTEE